MPALKEPVENTESVQKDETPTSNKVEPKDVDEAVTPVENPTETAPKTEVPGQVEVDPEVLPEAYKDPNEVGPEPEVDVQNVSNATVPPEPLRPLQDTTDEKPSSLYKLKTAPFYQFPSVQIYKLDKGEILELGHQDTNTVKLTTNSIKMVIDGQPIVSEFSALMMSCQVNGAPTVCGIKELIKHREGLDLTLKKYPEIEPTDPLISVLEAYDGQDLYFLKFLDERQKFTFNLYSL